MGGLKNLGTTEALFNLLSAVNFNKKSGLPVYMTILDLSKAYDRVWRTGLWTRLWSLGITGILLGAIHSTYTNPVNFVKKGNFQSESFQSSEGLRQGSVLSPLLFVLLISDVANALDRRKGIPTQEKGFFHCQLFIDDTVIMTSKETDIAAQIDSFNMFAAVWGSVLNISKTVILSTDQVRNEEDWLEKYLMKEAPANLARYLGAWISLKNDSWNQHFQVVISKARRAYFYLKSIGMRRDCMSPLESIPLFKILILPKLTFGAEVIIPSEAVLRKVDDFIGSCVKDLLGIPLSASNSTVLWEVNIPTFKRQLSLARLRFHWKLAQGPQSPKYAQSYISGNYLYDANEIMCQDLEIEWTLRHKKCVWKRMIGEVTNLARTKEFALANPGFAIIKPFPVLSKHLLNLKGSASLAILKARHTTGLFFACECGNGNGFKESHHILTECTRASILAERVALIVQFSMTFPTLDIANTTTLFRAMIGGLEEGYDSKDEKYTELLRKVGAFISKHEITR